LIASTEVVRFGLAPVAGLNQWPVAVAGFLLGCVIPVFLLAIFWCSCASALVVGTVHLEVCYLVSGGDKGVFGEKAAHLKRISICNFRL
jgi:hypothetical protein